MSFLFKIVSHFSIITRGALTVLWFLGKPVRYFENLFSTWSLICSNSSFSNTWSIIGSFQCLGKLFVYQTFIENVSKFFWVNMNWIFALLLDRVFISLRISSLENKGNENDFCWVLYFSLIIVTLSLFLK